MKPLELAMKYMEIFFSGKNIESLRDIFAADLSFCGPFYTFDSSEEYISSLISAPPEGFEYEIISSFESGTSACLIYCFTKPGISTPMAQFFETKDGTISKILLIFDSVVFK